MAERSCRACRACRGREWSWIGSPRAQELASAGREFLDHRLVGLKHAELCLARSGAALDLSDPVALEGPGRRESHGNRAEPRARSLRRILLVVQPEVRVER